MRHAGDGFASDAGALRRVRQAFEQPGSASLERALRQQLAQHRTACDVRIAVE